MTRTLGDALPEEIKRCQELVEMYKAIPTGAFGAGVIQLKIDAAHKAMMEQDLPAMLRIYQELKDCK